MRSSPWTCPGGWLLPAMLLLWTTVGVADTIPTPHTESPQETAVAGHWEPIFEDDFNEPTIDTKKWNINDYGRDNAQFRPANIWQADGKLVIKTQKGTFDKYNYTPNVRLF